MIVVAILAAGSPMQGVAADGEIDKTKRVLLLYSHKTTSPVNVDWDRGIRRALGTGFPEGLKIDVEHLDLDRSDEEYRATLVKLLRHKYSDVQIDLVVPFYIQATEFVLEQRGLFGDAPIVFCSVPIAVSDLFRSAADTTGVAFESDVVDTVQVAQDLFPDARRLLVLSGLSKGEQALLRRAQSSLDHIESEITIEYVSGLPLQQFMDKISRLDGQTLVLVLNYGEDIHGRNRPTVETVEILAEQSGAPLFGGYDTLLGHGIVGGRLFSAERQAELAGQLAVRVLKGEDANTVPVAKVDSEYMFDARQLRRWSIPKNRLPPHSQLRFSDATLWDRYGAYLIGIGVTVAVQTLVIAALVINRSRRIRAEQSLFASREQARELAGKLLSAQEDERRRLARELHDDLTQRLAAAAIVAGSLEHEAASSVASPERLAELKQDLVDISKDVHRMSRQIHPAILDDLGLADALRSECGRLADGRQIPIRIRYGELPEELPMSAAVCLYRIAQEALWNAVKHSQSEKIELTISADDESIHLEIRDWGVGFSAHESNGKAGIGLASMKERARLVHGILDIKSVPGQGTIVAVDVPLPEATL